MTVQELMQSFHAFNVNSLNSLIYIISSNIWLILSVIGSLAIIVMNVKEEIDDYVDEEQNII